MSTIAQRILAARKRTGKTQKEVAEQLGTTYQSYAQYERGTRNPKYGTIEKLAKALNCDISELLTPHEESEMIINSLIERLKDGRIVEEPGSSIDEDDFSDAFDEHEQSGILVQRYTDYVAKHPYLFQAIRDIGIELKIVDWHRIQIRYRDDETTARISELLDDLELLESLIQDKIKRMFCDYYGIQFSEPDTVEKEHEEDEIEDDADSDS